MTKTRFLLTTAIALGLVGASWFGSVVWKAETAKNFLQAFQKINETKPALTTAQVVQLMGQPIRIEHSESTGLVSEVYHYPTAPAGGDFQVIFVDGIVFHTALPVYTPTS